MRTPETLPENPSDPLDSFREQLSKLEGMQQNDPAFLEQLSQVRSEAEVLPERELDQLAANIEGTPEIREAMEERRLKLWSEISHDPDAKIEQKNAA